MKKTTEQGITALYCRLSRDDGAEGDSIRSPIRNACLQSMRRKSL